MRAAQQTRSNRRAILRQLADATTGAEARGLCAEHIDSPHQALATLEVRDLVVACRGIGRWHLNKILRAAGVDGVRMIGTLTERERTELGRVLREPWPHEGRP